MCPLKTTKHVTRKKLNTQDTGRWSWSHKKTQCSSSVSTQRRPVLPLSEFYLPLTEVIKLMKLLKTAGLRKPTYKYVQPQTRRWFLMDFINTKNCVSKDAMKKMEKGCCPDLRSLRSLSEKTVLPGICNEPYNSVLFLCVIFMTGFFSLQPGYSGIHSVDQASLKLKRSVCLCLPNARIKGVCHYRPASNEEFKILPMLMYFII